MPSLSLLRRSTSAVFILACIGGLGTVNLALGQGGIPLPPKSAAGIAEQTQTPYTLIDALPGLTFEQPVGIVSAPNDQSRLFILEKTGRIQVVQAHDGAAPTKSVFLDLTHPRDGALETSSECGVLGLAFPPDYAQSGRLYVYYSLNIGGKFHQRVSRFQVTPASPNQVDAQQEQPLWTQVDPANNHNGGDLHFGPDGYLYISVGDGGAADDKFDNARFINKGFFAAILRIDVDKRGGNLPPNPHPGVALDASGSAFYSIPKDNPFIGATSHHGQVIDPGTVRTEIWAAGLRNPWRFCFDPETKRLFTGDVGQNHYEEVDIITKGGDYGWSYREATHQFPKGPGRDQQPAEFPYVEPIFEYPRTTGISITGGVVYHGTKFPEIAKAYLLADFGLGNVIALREEGNAWRDQRVAMEPGIVAMGIDPRDGEVLFANIVSGKIKRLQKGTGAGLASQ